MLCTVPVSLRRLYPSPVSDEHVGNHFGMVCVPFDLDSFIESATGPAAVPNLWAAARAWKERLSAGIAAGEHLGLATNPPPTVEEVHSMLQAAAAGLGRTKAITVSNRGAFELPCDLVSFRHCNNIAAGPGPAFQLNAVTLNGAMYTTLTYVDPAVAGEVGQAIADALLANLRALAPACMPA